MIQYNQKSKRVRWGTGETHISVLGRYAPSSPNPLHNFKWNTTFSNGCLGSHNDEGRSEMRYVMRIARLRNHQNFERTLRFQEMPGSMLGWVSVNPTRPSSRMMSLSMMLRGDDMFVVPWLHWSEWSGFFQYLVWQLAQSSRCRFWAAVSSFVKKGLRRLTFGKCTTCMLGWCPACLVLVEQQHLVSMSKALDLAACSVIGAAMQCSPIGSQLSKNTRRI